METLTLEVKVELLPSVVYILDATGYEVIVTSCLGGKNLTYTVRPKSLDEDFMARQRMGGILGARANLGQSRGRSLQDRPHKTFWE